MTTLFENEAPHPLADRLRPRRLADIVGQDHLLGPEEPIGRMVASGQLCFDDIVGAAGLRQDDDRAATSPTVNAFIDSNQCRKQMPNYNYNIVEASQVKHVSKR